MSMRLVLVVGCTLAIALVASACASLPNGNDRTAGEVNDDDHHGGRALDGDEAAAESAEPFNAIEARGTRPTEEEVRALLSGRADFDRPWVLQLVQRASTNSTWVAVISFERPLRGRDGARLIVTRENDGLTLSQRNFTIRGDTVDEGIVEDEANAIAEWRAQQGSRPGPAGTGFAAAYRVLSPPEVRILGVRDEHASAGRIVELRFVRPDDGDIASDPSRGGCVCVEAWLLLLRVDGVEGTVEVERELAGGETLCSSFLPNSDL